MCNRQLVSAVSNLVTSVDAPDGYVSVLEALAEVMKTNPSSKTRKAAGLVSSLAEVLDEYLEDKDDSDSQG